MYVKPSNVETIGLNPDADKPIASNVASISFILTSKNLCGCAFANLSITTDLPMSEIRTTNLSSSFPNSANNSLAFLVGASVNPKPFSFKDDIAFALLSSVTTIEDDVWCGG